MKETKQLETNACWNLDLVAMRTQLASKKGSNKCHVTFLYLKLVIGTNYNKLKTGNQALDHGRNKIGLLNTVCVSY